MQFLKILFWCLLVFVAAVFTFGNWNTVDIHLWGGLIATINLPLLLFLTFLLGWIPTLIYYNAVRWRLRSRLSTTERALGDLRIATMPAPVVAEPGPEPIVPEPIVPEPIVPEPIVPEPIVTEAPPVVATPAKPRKGDTPTTTLFPDAS